MSQVDASVAADTHALSHGHGPLAGLRVIELAGIGPGPMAAMMLADMGAEVVCVDRPGGVASLIPADRDPSRRSRRSVSIDLSKVAGRDVLLAMIESADVLLEGNRPGKAEKLGLGPDECWKHNPRLVYARMTGWGQDGPLRERAGHDINYIALTGALAAIGRAEGPPVVPLNLLGDFAGGSVYLVVGILAAVREAERSGMGQVVDAAILDGVQALSTPIFGMRAAGHWTDHRGRNLLDSGCPWYDVYATADGNYVAVGAIEPQFFDELMSVLGLGWTSRDRDDQQTWGRMRRDLEEVFATRTRAEWQAKFERTDACVSPVLTFAEAAHHPHVLARDSYVEVAGVRQPRPAPRFSRTPASVSHRPELPGASTRDVLGSWGVGDLDGLEAAGVIFQR